MMCSVIIYVAVDKSVLIRYNNSMIYITGDTHGKRERFELLAERYGERDWTEKDTLIVCGDFGFIFLNNGYEMDFLDELEKKPYTICFCDGNHENFDALYSYPRERWCGGYIHRIRKNIIHLMRGQVFKIQGRTIFVMGGGYSIDRYARHEHLSWWKQELPSNSEYREAIQALKENDHKVDYIITHTGPKMVLMKKWFRKPIDMHEDELVGFFDWVRVETQYEKWFFGHWHEDCDIDSKHTVLLEEVRTVEGVYETE